MGQGEQRDPRAQRVLIVNGSEVVRRLIAVNLVLEGFDVTTAERRGYLGQIPEILPDVLILDMMIERLKGLQAPVNPRNRPSTTHIKVLLIANDYWQQNCLARVPGLGADAYLATPFDPGEIIHVVRRLAR